MIFVFENVELTFPLNGGTNFEIQYSFFEVWETAKGNIENYLYFKAAFDQFIKFETDGIRFLKVVWYFGDVKIIAVVRMAGINDYKIMTKEYYDVDQKKIMKLLKRSWNQSIHQSQELMVKLQQLKLV